MQFIPLGGADDIGASCFYLNIDGTGILLDCGIHPQKKGIDSLPKFELIEDKPLDFVLISHAHQDHIGALPFLVKKFPFVKIYSTNQTLDIAKITLHNAAKIISEQLTDKDPIKPFSHDDIDLLLRTVHTIEYNEEIPVAGMRHNSNENIKITFYDSGHILGSASVLIEHKGKRIFYTGDLKLSSQFIMNGAELPNKPVDVLITEATYAATDSSKIGTLRGETSAFVKSANEILSNGGSVLIPVFGLGKMQEILMMLYLQMSRGKLTETNIYTGGIGKKIAHVYDLNRYLIKRKNKEILLKEIEQKNYYDVVDLNHYRRKPGIVLASSGMMLENTTSYKLMNYWIRQKDFGIFIVGYMDPSTPGYKISSSGKGEKISLIGGDQEIAIKCDIRSFNFPSHSRREEILSVIENLKPGRVIMVHGDPKAKDWLGYNILDKSPKIKVHNASLGKSINF